MKQTDIYTEALICLRSILQTDHPEFKNWIGWLERDIEDWTQRREVSHHLRAYGEVWARSMTYPVCVEITTIFSAFSNQCAMPSVTFMENRKAFLRRH